MADDGKNIDQWDACSPGELTKLVHRLDYRQRAAHRKTVLNTALVSTIVFACVVLSLGSFLDQSSHYGGIACSQCREHIPEYQLHLIGQSSFEDEDLLASMKIHLQKCKLCRTEFNTLYPEQRITVSSTTRPVLMLALQPAWIAEHSIDRY